MRFAKARPAAPALLQRLVWLLACLGIGGVTGALGATLTGDDRWYLAIPSAIAIGWMFLADPSQCTPCDGAYRGRRDGEGE